MRKNGFNVTVYSTKGDLAIDWFFTFDVLDSMADAKAAIFFQINKMRAELNPPRSPGSEELNLNFPTHPTP